MTDELEPMIEDAPTKCRHCGAVPWSIGWCCRASIEEAEQAETATD